MPTDNVHRSLMEGRRRGDARLSVWVAVLAGRLGACTVQEDRQAEATGTAGVGSVTSSLCLKQVDGGSQETHCTESSSGGSSGRHTAPPRRGTRSSHRPRTCCRLPRQASCGRQHREDRPPPDEMPCRVPGGLLRPGGPRSFLYHLPPPHLSKTGGSSSTTSSRLPHYSSSTRKPGFQKQGFFLLQDKGQYSRAGLQAQIKPPRTHRV